MYAEIHRQTVSLYPFGEQLWPEDISARITSLAQLQAAIRCMLLAVKDLHAANFAHTDIQWPIVRDVTGDRHTDTHRQRRAHTRLPHTHTRTHTHTKLWRGASMGPTLCSNAGNDNNLCVFAAASVIQKSRFVFWRDATDTQSTGHLGLQLLADHGLVSWLSRLAAHGTKFPAGQQLRLTQQESLT